MTEEWRKIWEEVVANRTRLESCSRHQFTKDDAGFGSKFTCSNCGGKVDGAEIWAYEQGYKHGVNSYARQDNTKLPPVAHE